MTMPRRLCWLVAVTAWVTALCPLRVAGWLLTLYLTHGAGWLLAIRVALPSLAWAAAYLAIGVLYLRVQALRSILLILVVLLAAVGAFKVPSYVHQLSTLNLWHNVLAEGFWETVGRVTIACAAFGQQIAQWLQTHRHGAGQQQKAG